MLNVDYQDTGNIAKAAFRQQKSQQLSSHDRENMMRELWDAFNETRPGFIPPGIIFLPGQRLSIKGYGWAPSTWMPRKEEDYPNPLGSVAFPAELHPRGLLVRYPGFLLHTENRKAILELPGPEGEFSFPSDGTFSEWYTAKLDNWAPSNIKAGLLRNDETPLAIILSRPRPRHLQEIGLLVDTDLAIKQQLPDASGIAKILPAHIICRVKVRRDNRHEMIGGDCFDPAKFICGEVLDDSQRWYVDGLPSNGEAKSIEDTISDPQQQPRLRGIVQRLSIPLL